MATCASIFEEIEKDAFLYWRHGTHCGVEVFGSSVWVEDICCDDGVRGSVVEGIILSALARSHYIMS